jgi:hypothetical protein
MRTGAATSAVRHREQMTTHRLRGHAAQTWDTSIRPPARRSPQLSLAGRYLPFFFGRLLPRLRLSTLIGIPPRGIASCRHPALCSPHKFCSVCAPRIWMIIVLLFRN